MQEDDDNDLMEHQGVDTSILLHLFGRDGAGEHEFCTFMNNLQIKVIQIKLAEVCKGASTITFRQQMIKINVPSIHAFSFFSLLQKFQGLQHSLHLTLSLRPTNLLLIIGLQFLLHDQLIFMEEVNFQPLNQQEIMSRQCYQVQSFSYEVKAV